MRLSRTKPPPEAAPDALPGRPVETAPGPNRPRLGDLLVERAGVTEQQVAEAMLVRAATDKRLGTVLVELGVIDERQLTETLGTQLGLPMADLGQTTPEQEAV